MTMKLFIDITIDVSMMIYYTFSKSYTIHSFSSNNQLEFYTSLFIDRRFHISPPGATTQYTINEIYEDLPETDDNQVNSLKAQQHGYKIALKIAKTTSTGQILFFSTGAKKF